MSYAFVIETNQYAGNFERELGAWLTGKVQNGTKKGLPYALPFSTVPSMGFMENYKEKGFSEVDVIWVIDNAKYEGEEGYENIAGIWPLNNQLDYSSGSGNFNAVAIFFKNPPPESVQKFLLYRASSFNRAVQLVDELYWKKDPAEHEEIVFGKSYVTKYDEIYG